MDHLRKCATILGRERYFLILIAKNRENVFFCLIKLLANTVFLLIFLLYHNNFLPFCVFLNWREKIAFKSSHFDIITFFFKIQLSFILPLFSSFFCWDFVLNKGHFYILSIFVIATNFENQTANVAGNLFLWDSFNHLRHGHFHSLLSPS